MARRYGNTPNVLYEPYNEPLDVSWEKVLKPYHEAVIDSIREHDPDNIVIVGTRNWSQQVAEAAANPIRRSNVAYTLHFYANTHGQWLRDQAQAAMNAGAALFVTEYGTTDATGNGAVNEAATRRVVGVPRQEFHRSPELVGGGHSASLRRRSSRARVPKAAGR